jgi:hypothetical protein
MRTVVNCRTSIIRNVHRGLNTEDLRTAVRFGFFRNELTLWVLALVCKPEFGNRFAAPGLLQDLCQLGGADCQVDVPFAWRVASVISRGPVLLTVVSAWKRGLRTSLDWPDRLAIVCRGFSDDAVR